MIQPPFSVPELYNVSGAQLRQIRADAVGTCPAVVQQESPEKLHARPGGRAVVRVYVVPPVFRGVVHYAAAREQALRYIISTISADVLKVVVPGISRQRPAKRVRHRPESVVAYRNKHLYHLFQNIICNSPPRVTAAGNSSGNKIQIITS